MSDRTVRYWPKSKPIPEGWVHATSEMYHHGAYSILIERETVQTRVEQFDEAVARVTQDRGLIYGHPSIDFDRASRLKSVVAECKDPRIRHAMDQICTKLARLIETPDHMDSWIDIAGYARTAVMVLDHDG